MAKKIDPELWAKELVRAQTDKGAHGIVNTYRQPMLGKDKDVINVMAPWYERAYKWLQKNHPLPLEE